MKSFFKAGADILFGMATIKEGSQHKPGVFNTIGLL